MAKVKLSDVIIRANTKVDKDNTDLIYYVGGEHFCSGDVTVDQKGLIAGSTIGPMFYYGFKAGQFLLVSRNPHLRKAGVVNFDGICSEKTFVLESADPQVLSPAYLPFVLQNERFWNYAVEHKHGSTNFFINWSTLANYEFELPELAEQERIARLAWAAQTLKKKYINQVKATDELVKSQFIEMFGTIDCEGVLPRVQWKNVLTIINGKDYKAVAQDDGEYPVYGTGGIMARASQYLCPENSVLMGRKGTIDNPLLIREKFWNVDTAFGVVPEPDKLNCVYLYWYCKQLDFTKLNKATTLPSTTKVDLLNLWINVPEMEEQLRFAEFAEQSDKSKFELQEAIIRIDNLIKSLIQQDSE